MGVIEKQSIQDIADAIRDRNGLTTLYKPRQMDEAIRGLYKTEAVNHVFDNLTVSTTKENTSFTLDDAEGEAEITEIKGNTTQEGTPTPSNPIEVQTVSGDNNIVVSGENELDEQGLLTKTFSINVYKNALLDIKGKRTLYFKAQLKEGKANLSGLYLAIATTQNPNSGTNAFCIRNGSIVGLGISNTFETDGIYLSFYPTSYTIEQILETYNLWISKNDVNYVPFTGYSEYRVDLGGKNLLNNTATTQTINGITFTVNSDKSVTVNGTATAHSLLYLGSQTISAGTYTVSGCPKNGSWGTYSLSYGNYNDSGNGSTLTLTSSLTTNPYIRIGNGTTVSNLTFYPQLEKRKCSNSIQSIYCKPYRTM